MYDQQAYQSDPAFVKKPRDEASTDNQDFSDSPEIRKAKIEITLQTQRHLSYIIILDSPLKLLVDTTANQ